MSVRFFLPVAFVFVAPRIAAAHGVIQGVGDFYNGTLGLLTGPIDTLTWLALGFFAGMHPMKRAGWCAESFAGGILLGLASARLGLLPPVTMTMDVVPLAAVGLLMAGGRPLVRLVLLIACAVGFVRGWHFGDDTLGRTDVLALWAGFVLTGYVVVTCSIAASGWFLANRVGWRIITLRAAGSWITAVAAMVAGFALRR